MTFAREAFNEDYQQLREPIMINTANGATIRGTGYGSITIRIMLLGSEERNIRILDILYIPDLAGSLLSVTQFQDRGILIRTTLANEMLIEKDSKVIGIASRRGRSYMLNTASRANSEEYARIAAEVDADTWYRRFGHLEFSTLKGLEDVTTGLKGALPSCRRDDCSIYSVTKAVRVINRKQPERATKPLECIHSDIWGPISILERLGAIYFISFIDDFTCKAWIYLTKN